MEVGVAEVMGIETVDSLSPYYKELIVGIAVHPQSKG
jgi:hypothetical protein